MGKIFTFRNFVLVAIGLSGMAALIYEVVWTRMLTLIFGSTVYAVATMLCAFMAGLALGSYLMARRVDRIKDLAMYFGLLELGIGIYGILFLLSLSYLQYPYFWLYQALHNYFWLFIFAQFLLYFFVMLLPTTMFGAVFPLASKIFTKSMAEVGKDVGYVYSANSLGSVIGPFLAGFILIPIIGVSKTAILAAVINISLGLVILKYSKLRRDIKFFLPFMLIFLILGFQQTMLPTQTLNFWMVGVFKDLTEAKETFKDITILFYKEGPYSTITVNRFQDGIGLKSDGRGEASTFFDDMVHQVLLAYIPMMLHPNPEKVLNVGSGGGFTLGTMANFDPKELHGVEIDPVVLEAADKFFSPFNNDVYNDPRTKVFVTDARNYLLMTKEKYDVIVSAPSHPIASGVSHLFTKEFFELAKSRLKNEDGIYSQWVPGFRFSFEELKIVSKTFSTVFPHTTLWVTTPHPFNKPNQQIDLFLVGTLKPLRIDEAKVAEKIESNEKIKNEFGKLGIVTARDFSSLMIFDENLFLNFIASEKRLNTDNKPLIEFLAPKAALAESIITPQILITSD